MTADAAQREPTMEEILASIRRIISEDDKPAEEAAEVLNLAPEPPPAPPPVAKAPPPPKPAPPPPPPPQPAPPPADDLMVLENEDAPIPEPVIDEETPSFDEPEPTPAPQPAPATAPKPVFRAPVDEHGLVGEPAAAKAAGALGRLMGSMMVQSGVTLDDVVRELLKPMLKEWLDANLPQIVESEVAKEIERIRRMAR